MTSSNADRGSVTLFMVISVVGLLALIGLEVDGGARVRAVQRADTLAAEAARAAGQAIDVPAAIPGGTPVVDPASAQAAARRYLAANDVTGTVAIRDGGRTVAVDVTTTAPTIFLGIIGISSFTAHGEATATLTHGIVGAEP